jgi:predicted RNA-binding Zn ribbon-like protein
MLVTMTKRAPPDERSAPEPRTPAPGTLALVQQFINSSGLLQGSDEFATDALSATWRREINGSKGSVSDGDRRRLVATREGVRDLLEAHTGKDVDPAVLVRLEKLLRRPRLRLALSPAGANLAVDCEGVDAFLGRISTAIVEATLLGTWKRLKVCRRETCRWVYYDYSKNGCSRWCSMRVCGSHEKARAYRARHGRSAPKSPVGVGY